MLDTEVPETYLPDAAYDMLVENLMVAADSYDHKSRVIELLGEVVNVWPARVIADVGR